MNKKTRYELIRELRRINKALTDAWETEDIDAELRAMVDMEQTSRLIAVGKWETLRRAGEAEK